MERHWPWVTAVIAICTAGGATAVGLGIYVGSTKNGNPTGWFVAAGLLFVAAVLVPIFVFVMLPLTARADAWAFRTFTDARTAKASARAAAVAKATPAARLNAAAQSRRPVSLSIESAYYGASGTFLDVEAKVTDAIRDARVDMIVSAAALGVRNTNRGDVKELRVAYSYRGDRRNKTCKEGERLILP